MNVEDRRVFYHLLSGLTAVEEPTFQARRLCRALTARCVTIARMPLPEYSWLTVRTDSLLGIAMGWILHQNPDLWLPVDLALSEHRQPAGQGFTDRDPLVVTIERQEKLFSHGIGRASAAVLIR